MLTDRRELSEHRFQTLLMKWLAELPSCGWEGTSHELGDELHAFGGRHRWRAYVPICPGRPVDALSGFLAASGHTLTLRRTKQARPRRFTATGSSAAG